MTNLQHCLETGNTARLDRIELYLLAAQLRLQFRQLNCHQQAQSANQLMQHQRRQLANQSAHV